MVTKNAKSSRSTKTAAVAKTKKKTNNSNRSNNPQGGTETVGQVAKGIGFLSILEALVLGVLGVMFILYPGQVTQLIFYVVGIFLMVKGIYKVINFFAMHSKTDFYNNDLLYGVLALVFGVLLVTLHESLQSMIGIIVGVWVIYSALVRMNTSIKMHAAGLKEWFYVFLLAAVMLALGIYAIIDANTVSVAMGWVLLIAAVVSIVDDTIFLRRVHDILD